MDENKKAGPENIDNAETSNSFNDPDLTVNEVQIDYSKEYTYTDYLQWPDYPRYEIIDGLAYLMSSPNLIHQELLMNLSAEVRNYLKGKACKVFAAPCDVRLDAQKKDRSVVQPDLIIVCDRSILDGASITGVPDMVAEILSPSTAKYDMTVKFNKYQKSGIREYWIIDPVNKTVIVHILKGTKYVSYPYTSKDKVPVHVLEDCVIDLCEIFEE